MNTDAAARRAYISSGDDQISGCARRIVAIIPAVDTVADANGRRLARSKLTCDVADDLCRHSGNRPGTLGGIIPSELSQKLKRRSAIDRGAVSERNSIGTAKCRRVANVARRRTIEG